MVQKKDLDNGITKDEFKTLDQIKRELKGEDDESKKLLELLDNLTATVEQEEYKENDGNHTNDTQTIAITNKLSGTKSIEFHKQWNDIYAFDSGKRPDLYLTLYQLTGDNLITEYREYHWDKSLQTEEGEGGQQGQGEETEEPPQEGGTETQAQDNYYWTCIFNNLPKYDEDGNEIFYYAVENLAVNDPSTFHYAYPVFEYGEKTFDSVYGEGGKPSLPSKEDNKDDETGQEILKEVKDDKVALLEGGTFVNNLEEDVTINGVKLWANLPLTASEADLPSVTFNVYQFSSDVTGTSDSNNGTLVAKLEVTSEMWKNSSQDGSIKPSGNQYTFTIDEMNVEAHTGPLPLYDEDGRRYTYTLEEVLVTEGEGDTDDWNLVYHNETFNEYQITNTYDPQLGALSVKKLLSVPRNSQPYAAIQFALYRQAPNANGEGYGEPVLVEKQVWTSGEILMAIQKEQEPPLSPTVEVEKTFTFENLPIYAPNGEKYQYFVAEILDDGSGYEMNYEAAVVKGDVGTIDEVFISDATKPEEGAAELATKPLEVKPNQDWSNGSDDKQPSNGTTSDEAKTPRATFGDRYQQGEITLKGTKKWNDQGNALGLRPEPGVFKNYVKLYRYAEPQEGQYNGIGSSTSPILVENASFTWSGTDTDTWNYEITGLEQYAPNGMPWIYIVRENLTEMGAEEYIPTNQKTVDGDKIGEVSSDKGTQENQTITMPPLTNTLTTSQSFQKQWQNHDGGSITEDYLGLGDITITGELWVGEKGADGKVSNMQKASEYFTSENGWIGPDKWWDEKPDFTVDLITQLGDNDQTKTISNLPRVAVENGDTKELVYAIVEAKIKVTNPDYTQSFIWKWEDGKLTVESKTPDQGLFTPQEITVGGSTTIINNRLQTTDLSVEKKWKGDEKETDLRPDSITVVVQRRVKPESDDQSGQEEELTRSALMAPRTVDNEWEIVKDSLTNEPLTLTLNVSNNWQQTISNLPTYGIQDNGLVTYDYRIRELKQGWTPDTIEDSILDADEKYNGHYTVSSYDEDGSTLTVTNTLTHMDITAVKAWKPEGLHGDYAEVTFTLQSRVVGSGDDAWKDVVDAGGKLLSKKLTGEEDPAWTVTWTELPRENDDGQTLEYKVLETLSEHFESDEDKKEPVEIIYPKDTITGGTAEKKYTVTNIPLGQITVTKEGGDGNGLAGVEFTLNSDSSTQMPVVGTTDVNGELTFAKLPLYDEQTGEPITYTLTETSTPDGYIQLTEPIEVSFTAETKPDGGVYWETDDGFLLHEVAYEVVNGQYFPVVHTGGSGFYWPGVLGAGAAAAGVLYLIRRKTKGHNTEQ